MNLSNVKETVVSLKQEAETKIASFKLDKTKAMIAGGVVLFLCGWILLSMETNEEKLAKIINTYDQERIRIQSRNNADNDYMSGVINTYKEKTKTNNECNKKLEKEMGTISAPSCESNTGSSIIRQASADNEGENISTFSSFVWRVNKAGQSKSREELCSGTTSCSFAEILYEHGLPIEPFIAFEKQYKIRKETVLCIAWADSGLGRYLKTKNNIGNVGNNDRGDRVDFASKNDGIEAIFKVLNGNYLKHKQSIGSLSPGGGGTQPFYATSPENWNLNVLNCLNTIVDEKINENSIFRI